MKKIVSAVLALTFAFVFGSAFAADATPAAGGNGNTAVEKKVEKKTHKKKATKKKAHKKTAKKKAKAMKEEKKEEKKDGEMK